MLNTQIRELHSMKNGVDERSEQSVIQWFDQIARIEKSRIFKKVQRGVDMLLSSKLPTKNLD